MLKRHTGKDCQANDWPTHKHRCKRQNYLLKVHLCPNDITDPAVSRTISCPANATFEDLHQALQIAFGWASTHCYDFKVKDPVEEARRDAEAPESAEHEMVSVIQHMMVHGTLGPTTSYLLRIVDEDPQGPGGFMSGRGIDFMHNKSRQHPQTQEKLSSKVKLHDVLDKPAFKDKPLEYEYDFGDRWEHAITLVGRKDATDFFMCTDGEGHGVAEDVGSAEGWEDLKKAYRAGRPTEEQKERMRWFEQMASNADPKGLGNGRERAWAKGMVNRQLGELAGKVVGFT